MSQLALSASFEYLCYGSTVIINIYILTFWKNKKVKHQLKCMCYKRLYRILQLRKEHNPQSE